MNDDIKNYINEEVKKTDLRLAVESERIQRLVSESRLNFYIKLLSAVGAVIAIALPLILSWILSSRNTAEFDRMDRKIEEQNNQVRDRLDFQGRTLEKRVDSAITSMNSEIRRTVNDFSRIQSKPPRFSATVNGKQLEGQLITLSSTLNSFAVAIINNGEGTAKNIGFAVYSDDSTFFDNVEMGNFYPQRLPFVDEHSFKAGCKLQFQQSVSLSPQEQFAFDISVQSRISSKDANMMLKVTYEQGIPRKFLFKIRFTK